MRRAGTRTRLRSAGPLTWGTGVAQEMARPRRDGSLARAARCHHHHTAGGFVEAAQAAGVDATGRHFAASFGGETPNPRGRPTPGPYAGERRGRGFKMT